MKSKKLLIFLSLFAIIGLSATIYFNRHSIFPSDEMILLRQIEAELNLPKTDERYEVDKGRYKSWKGTWYYDRHISFNYSDPRVVEILREKLLANAWVEDSTDTYNTEDYTHFSFTKNENDTLTCIDGLSMVTDEGETEVYFALRASGELGCTPE